jgi:quercetin dioxygenase-like cupin family protein
MSADLGPGTVLCNPITGEYARVIENSSERAVGELIANPGGAVAAPHHHPGQEETFEVLEGVLGYRCDAERGELTAGTSLTIPRGVVHDWWNAGGSDLRARVTVEPGGSFVTMIAAVWGLASLGRTSAKGMPGLLDRALLAEAFGHEIVFDGPPVALQRMLARSVAPLARRLGRSVTSEEVLASAILPAEGK